MKRMASLITALSILAVGCGGGANGAATLTAEPSATPAPATATPEPTPAPTAAPTLVSVTWDGTTCDYRGPAVVPRGAQVLWAFANIGPAVDDDSILAVGAVQAGTTWDDVREAEKIPASQWPPPIGDLSQHYALIPPNGSWNLQMLGDMYYVGCGTSPSSSDRYTAADLVYVIGR
jgi:hypothetical protein